jgi:hypothetical protein
MAKSKLAGVFAVLIALTLFFGGMLTYKVMAGTGAKALVGASSARTPTLRSEGIGIQGKVGVQVYSSSGRLLTSLETHNHLVAAPINNIAACVSGLASTTDGYPEGCASARINEVQLCSDPGGSNCLPSVVGTNVANPPGCIFGANPAIGQTFCTGWQTTATIPITVGGRSFTSVLGENAHTAFDVASLPSTISPNVGDTVVITITFTIS